MAGQFEKLPNPSVLPSGTGFYISFGGGSEFLVMPSVIYRCQGNKLTKIGGTVPNSDWGSAISKNGQYVATVNGSSVYLYKHDGNGNLQELSFSKPAKDCRSPSFSLDNNYFAVGTNDTKGVAIYKRSGDTFTKLTPIGTIPDGHGRGTSWSSCGNYLAVGTYSNDVAIYKRSGDVFTRLATPTVKPVGGINGCSFSRNADYLAYSHNSSPYITIYKRSGDTFTKLANPVSLPEYNCYGCAFSPGGRYLAVAVELAGKSVVYERNGDTFTKIKTLSGVAGTYGVGVGFSGDGKYLVFGGTNNMSIYSGPMEVLDLQRFLLKSGGYTTIVGGAVKALPETTLSSALFEREGFVDLASVLSVLPNLDRQFDLLVYDTESATAGIKLDYLPHLQLVIPTEAIVLPEFQCLVGTELVTAGTKGLVTVVLSVDGGLKWLSYDTDDWAEVALTAAAVKATGMSPAQLAGVTVASWEKLKAKEIRMAYLLEKSSLTDDLAVNEWRLRLMQNAVWQEGDHKVDYAYRYSNSTTLVVKLLKDGSYKVNMMAVGEKG